MRKVAAGVLSIVALAGCSSGTEAGMVHSCVQYLDADDIDYTKSWSTGTDTGGTHEVFLVDNNGQDAGTCEVEVTEDKYRVSSG
jgi:hypothetical protein